MLYKRLRESRAFQLEGAMRLEQGSVFEDFTALMVHRKGAPQGCGAPVEKHFTGEFFEVAIYLIENFKFKAYT